MKISESMKSMIKYNPLVSIIISTYNTYSVFLTRSLESIIDQTYENWELCIIAKKNELEIDNLIKIYGNRQQNINVIYFDENKSSSECYNQAVNVAKGEYIAILNQGDILKNNALQEVVNFINEKQNVDVIYSDEEIIDKNDNISNQIYKPDWSPDLLYTQMYINQMLVLKKSIFDRVGGFRKQYARNYEYDLVLRISRETNDIFHISKILYSFRNARVFDLEVGLKALNEHLTIKYNGNAYANLNKHLGVYDSRFKMDKNIKVSIIIPTKDKLELIKPCIDSILEKTSYNNYEILIINNNSVRKETYKWFDKTTTSNKNIRVINANYKFNWSKLNNQGIKEAKGDVFIFLNNDTKIISHDWLERLAENALRDEIGTVGALLLYQDDSIQHSGVVLGMSTWADHVYKGLTQNHKNGPYISPMVSRNVLASTGACLAISRNTIDKIGKFNEEFIICGSDVEISLRAIEKGLINLYNANVKLYHLESQTRDFFIPKTDFVMSEKCYKKYWEEGDPYYNINLDLNSTRPQKK